MKTYVERAFFALMMGVLAVAPARSEEGMRAALADGASTMGVLAMGGTELNPIMPGNPIGIVIAAVAKGFYIDSRDMDDARERHSAVSTTVGFEAAAANNLAAMLGLGPVAPVAGLVYYLIHIDDAQANAEAARQHRVAARLAALDTRNAALREVERNADCRRLDVRERAAVREFLGRSHHLGVRYGARWFDERQIDKYAAIIELARCHGDDDTLRLAPGERAAGPDSAELRISAG